MAKTFKVKSSRIEDGQEICNTCVRLVDKPYRYKTPSGETRGCVASCHDVHVRRNANPAWMSRKRYVLPKWITEARRNIANFERVVIG
jgi:hypothetical protein